MDLAYFHLWSAGYTLPATSPPVEPPPVVIPRRGKVAAKAKRQKAAK